MTDRDAATPVPDERKNVLRKALAAIDALQARLDAVERDRREPIAIVGLSSRFPGAPSAEAYWELLEAGRDAVTRVPADRWPDSAVDAGAPENLRRPWGGFLENLDQFDATFFGISGREAETMDPQQRLVLETTWEALEHAGIAADRLRGSATGVFIGITCAEYARLGIAHESAALDVYTATGGALNVAAGRIAYLLGLHGPAMAIDTACSSSLVALHQACRSLRAREIDCALAGGVNTLLTPEPFVCFAKWGMMAPDGRCKTFDERADGFVRAEGCGMVVLKRLSDARAAGDRILAVIRGTAVNQDGASSGLTVPNGLAQQAVVKSALQDGGVKPGDIDYIEAHGTGTTLGDPIELEALAAVLTKDRPPSQPLRVGSVKTNIGHTESASGIAGLIKVVLSLQHEAIPPHLHFTKLSPRIGIGQAPIEVPVCKTPWPRQSRPRLAGVSSFGFSGTNAHVVLEEAPVDAAIAAPASPDRDAHVLILSSKSDAGLRQLAEAYVHHLDAAAPDSLADICHTAAVGRSALSHRLALPVRELATARDTLARFAATAQAPGVITGRTASAMKVAFLFTGQGAQYRGMGRMLYETAPVFRHAFDQCAAGFRPHLEHDLLDVIGYRDDASVPATALDETRYTQPALFSFEFALASLWRSWGIEPAAVAGHSLGEFVAACMAGVLSLDDAVHLVAVRSRLMQALPRNGAMAAILATEDRVRQAIAPFASTVAIAAVNGPRNIVVSGLATDVSALLSQLKAEGVDSRPLNVSHAFHSPLIEPMLAELDAVASSREHRAPLIDLALNGTGTVMDGSEPLSPEYWSRHARGTVRFAACIHALRERGITAFLEIGPAPVLIGMGRQCLAEPDLQWLPSMVKDAPAWTQLLSSLGSLFVAGARPHWQAFDQPYARRRVDLPHHPFRRKRFWLEPAPARTAASGPALPADAHPLLGQRAALPLRETVFSCGIDAGRVPVLREHKVAGLILFPAAGYIELAHAAAKSHFGSDHVSVEAVLLRAALVLDERQPLDVRCVITPADAESAGFEVFSRAAGASAAAAWTSHASGRVRHLSRATAVADSGEAFSRCTTPIDVSAYQQRMRDVGLEYGPSFQALTEAKSGGDEACGELRLPADEALAGRVDVHPGMLDAAFHLIGLALGSRAGDLFYLPVGFESAEILAPLGARGRAHVRLTSVEPSRVIAEARVWRADGTLAVHVRGLQVRPITREQFRQALGLEARSDLYQIVWRPDPDTSRQRRSNAHHVVLGSGPEVQDVLASLAASAASAEAAAEADVPALLAKHRGRRVALIDLRALALPDFGQLSADSSPATLLADGPASDVLSLLRTVAATGSSPGTLRLVVPTIRAHSIQPEEMANPLAATVWGMLGTAAAECPQVEFCALDLESTEQAGPWIARAAMRQDRELRLAVRSGMIHVARLVPLSASRPQALELPDGPHELYMQDRGTLSGLGIRPVSRRSPGVGEVEVEVLASGLNFRDVLNLLNMYPGPAGPLGNECCGRVVAVGEQVEGVKVGDLVTCIAESTFATHVIAKAPLAFPVPPELSVAQAAAFPIAQLTAYLALHHIGGMRPGDTVLIHAGAGGVGLAAIHLALAAGATVIATAGSNEKRAYLRDLGVHHVFDSRQTLPAETVRNATQGHGVDLLLNSLTGEFIDEGLRSLAPGGRFLEIGLREMRSPEQVQQVRSDVSYHPLLLGDWCNREPAKVRAMYDAVIELLTAGRIPAPRTRGFAIAEAEAAFRHMAKARHIGRISIVHRAARQTRVRPDASYVVTGGLGGLGLHVAGWLADQGARHLVLVGRSEPSADALRRLSELRSRRVEVEVVRADIGTPEGVQFVQRTGRPPLRGVIHAAGILDDAILSRVDGARLRRVLHPKADGATRIARALAGTDLDFLVLFSSGSALLGSPGQTAYAGANAFLDAFAHRLHAAGQRALSVNWGAWADGGMASRLDARTQQDWAARGIGTYSVSSGLAALERALSSGCAQVAALPMDWAKVFRSLGDNAPSLLAELAPAPAAGPGADAATATATASAGTSPREQLAGLPAAERLPALTRRLQQEAAAVLGAADPDELDPKAGLTEQGMDSLMAVEFASRLGRSFGVTLPATFVFDYPNLAAVARHLLSELMPADSARKDEPVAPPREAEELAGLSEADLESELRRELDRAGF